MEADRIRDEEQAAAQAASRQRQELFRQKQREQQQQGTPTTPTRGASSSNTPGTGSTLQSYGSPDEGRDRIYWTRSAAAQARVLELYNILKERNRAGAPREEQVALAKNLLDYATPETMYYLSDNTSKKMIEIAMNLYTKYSAQQ